MQLRLQNPDAHQTRLSSIKSGGCSMLGGAHLMNPSHILESSLQREDAFSYMENL